MKLLSRPEEFVLLAVWRLQEDAYSLPIRKQLSATTGHDWSLGSVFSPLDRLEKKGLLVSMFSDATPERGGRPKRIYRLTMKGRQALLHTRKVEESMWVGITGLATEV